ncbi:MAG: response regulator [Acidobacteria bacterium]|nr:response regulator [Acidobacteriota bacterium]
MSTAGEAYRPLTQTPFGSIFRPARILVADGDVLGREVVCRKLESLGYACESCADDRTALEMISAKAYDLVLTDSAAPGKGGADFIEKVLKRRPEIAVILVTPVVNIEVAVEALKQGAYDYITKPFSLEEMSAGVSRALEKRRLIMENKSYRRTLEEQVASRTDQLQEALGILEQTYRSTLVALSKALDSRHADSDGHTLRITVYASRLAREMGMGESDIRTMEQGILLHDVGNIGMPDALMGKKDSLDESERLLMRKHPEIGYGILSRIKFLKEPAQLVLQHHERYDGKGYPQGLKGDAIHPGARVFAVADMFETLTCSRSSFKAENIDRARNEIKKMSGTLLDPGIVDRFLRIPVREWKEIGEHFTCNAGLPKMRRVIPKTNGN